MRLMVREVVVLVESFEDAAEDAAEVGPPGTRAGIAGGIEKMIFGIAFATTEVENAKETGAPTLIGYDALPLGGPGHRLETFATGNEMLPEDRIYPTDHDEIPGMERLCLEVHLLLNRLLECH